VYFAHRNCEPESKNGNALGRVPPYLVALWLQAERRNKRRSPHLPISAGDVAKKSYNMAHAMSRHSCALSGLSSRLETDQNPKLLPISAKAVIMA
jgi:hypothetical protein